MNANATLNTTLPPAVLRGSLPSLEGIQSLELFSGYGAHCRIIGRSSYAGLPTAEILQANFEPEARRGSLGVGTARIFSCLGQDRLPLMHLESLSLREFTEDMYLDAHTFAQVLGSLPSITSLALVECSKRLAEALVVTPTSHVCPRLQELRLHDSKILDETLVELVRSRTTSPTSRSVSRSNSSAGPSYGGSSQSQGESRGALRILKLARCGFVDQASVTQMRAILAVEWDGLGLVRSALPPSSDAVLPELV
ncbi:hypothetical protein BOTBODRAFT_57879 [Botryobasidium botryosum FD-172 SS1]|uniref:Uncharacterized protein n=1 Tax=Botryobasidium botryosum (strain FD-172 SS1) TaxID=930990 RepID=A0A067M4E0_BOTB1|nr:hypothetical protein BOTBODRAFT_57879 [Botryobasidium botryosum FD-172 SS1]